MSHLYLSLTQDEGMLLSNSNMLEGFLDFTISLKLFNR